MNLKLIATDGAGVIVALLSFVCFVPVVLVVCVTAKDELDSYRLSHGRSQTSSRSCGADSADSELGLSLTVRFAPTTTADGTVNERTRLLARSSGSVDADDLALPKL